jgi:hypothetical protein
MKKFEMQASLNGEVLKGLNLPVIVMDDDFLEYLEEESIDTENGLDIVDFAIYYLEWEAENVK